MRKLLSLVLYTALLLGANGVAAQEAAIADLRQGDMKKLVLHETPKPVSDAIFLREDGADGQLSDYTGKYVLLNFWATWCAPCRKEMPALDALQAELGGDMFEVVTIATGHNPPPAMKKFFAKAQVQHLPLHRDPKQALARKMAVLGLPVTVLINPEGQEIGRLIGDADWHGAEAVALINALIEPEA